MKAWVHIFDHPYFAVTDDDGKFEIKDAPMGKFKLYLLHDSGFNEGKKGAAGQVIAIDKDKVDLEQIQFKPEEKKK
jgi:hypothetical protein